MAVSTTSSSTAFSQPHGEVLDGLSVVEDEHLVLVSYPLSACYPDGVVTDAHRLDMIPHPHHCLIGRECGDHLQRPLLRNSTIATWPNFTIATGLI
jgi:hypothetical protein